MSHRNSSLDKYVGSDVLPDSDTSGFISSENSTVNGSQDNLHDPYNDESYLMYNYPGFFYKFYEFEEKIYVNVWTVLVFLTVSANMLLIAVFVRKSMRTSTNLILLFIAISDSLTGLVTLPTYIHVFTSGMQGWVKLNEGWCMAFTISKFYISKGFHTVSIWQTLLLGFQRFCCVWFPFKTKSWFTTRRTLIAVAVITICAFVIHTYHLYDKKLDKEVGLCLWIIEGPCVEFCAFLWITLLLVNILPCVLLLVFTILIIQKLFHQNIPKGSLKAERSRERDQQNKRASIIVVCIAIIFMIPEIPYGILLLVTVMKMHSGQEIMSLRESRLYQVMYETALLISFHANFWVYIIMSRRFREELKSTFLDIMSKLLPKRTTVTLTRHEPEPIQ